MAEMSLKEFKALAVDFDGTLTVGDLHTPARLTAYERLAQETGDIRFIQIDPGIHLEAHLHASTSAGINAWIMARVGIIDGPLDVEHEHVVSLVQHKQSIYSDLVARGQDEVPGATSFIKKASVRKPGKLGIVTTAHIWEVSPFLERHRLNPYIPRRMIVSAEDLSDPKHVKPNPEAYEIFIGKVSLSDPADLLVIEDTPFGIESAKRAGATVVAIASSRTHSELANLRDFQMPDAVVKDYAELESLLSVSS